MSDRQIDTIRQQLRTQLQSLKSLTLHGVMLEHMGFGILIRGEASIGKSELALNLIQKGAKLIADDAVIVFRQTDNLLYACCDSVIEDMLHVRDLGVMNIRKMYGDESIAPVCRVELVIELSDIKDSEKNPLNHIDYYETYFELPLPVIKLQNVSQRKLESLIEAILLNHRLQHDGYNAKIDIQQRQQQRMKSQ